LNNFLDQRDAGALSTPPTAALTENISNKLSHRKKFRKMMHRFDEQMYHSDTLYRREYQAEQKAKKLAQENE
jgi:hypothetical protein